MFWTQRRCSQMNRPWLNISASGVRENSMTSVNQRQRPATVCLRPLALYGQLRRGIRRGGPNGSPQHDLPSATLCGGADAGIGQGGHHRPELMDSGRRVRRNSLQSSPPKTSETSGMSCTETITLGNRNRHLSVKCTK